MSATGPLLIGLLVTLASTAVYLLVLWLIDPYEREPISDLGIMLLAGIPFFYLLTFGGRAEETEVEIGAICGIMCLGLWLWPVAVGGLSPFPFTARCRRSCSPRRAARSSAANSSLRARSGWPTSSTPTAKALVRA